MARPVGSMNVGILKKPSFLSKENAIHVSTVWDSSVSHLPFEEVL
jgi:hypothetical protein